jgi:microcin C transport system substrate-binding protein
MVALLALGAWSLVASAEEAPAVPLPTVEVGVLDAAVFKSHAIAMHGQPKYGPDFQHFDYADPDAPKGGEIRFGERGGFDSFNPFIPKGNPAAGVGFLFETLLTSSRDEPFTEYGLIAESLEWPEDRSWVIFTLRPEARWHDGKPITPEDVLFSLDVLKEKGHPQYRFYYRDIVTAEKLDAQRVKMTFADTENRELPLIAGQIPILPKHYWEGRDFGETTLEPPVGSGPYRIKSFEPGRNIVWERVDDYWGRDLPVNRGHYNFDILRYEYYRDATIIREALKAGQVDYRVENQAKAWAVDYDVPAVRNGWLIKEAISHQRTSGMQAFVMNTRRAVFADPRVRQALAYAFDFEWTNRNLFNAQYTRTNSYFANSDLAAEQLPQGEELEILERYRGRVPGEVFTTVYEAPATDGSGWPRANLDRAFELLAEAGWVVKDMVLVNEETGRQMRFEILLVSKEFERIVLPFKRNFTRLGIDVRVRLVDPAQYINRIRSFDFDMVVSGWGQSNSPGNEQGNFWSSQSADVPGSRNLAGVRDPVIDELVELVIAAPNRESLIARTRALDRVLLWSHYVIPNWHIRVDRVLYWNKFSRPEVTPILGTSSNFWWFDEAKAAALAAARSSFSAELPDSGGGGDRGIVTSLLIAALLLAAFLGLRRLRRGTPA